MKALALTLILSIIPTLASATEIGPLVQVDSNYGYNPAIAFDPDGNAIVVYGGGASNAYQILGNRFDGLTPTTEFPVNTTPGFCSYPTLTTFADGGWVAGWISYVDGVEPSYFRRFDNTGSPRGDDVEIPLSAIYGGWIVDIATSPSGPFDIYWYCLDACGVGYCNLTYCSAFGSAGDYLGLRWYVGGLYAYEAAVGSNVAGDVVAACGIRRGDKYNPGDWELRYCMTTVGGPLGPSTPLTVPNTPYYDVDVAPSGAFVIVWSDIFEDTYRVRAQRFDDQGNAVGGAMSVFETATAANYPTKVACGANGDFLVVWVEDHEELVEREGRIFAAHVSPLDVISGPFALNGASQNSTLRFDVDASPGGIYAVVFGDSQHLWMRTITPDPPVPVAFAGVWATWESRSVRVAWDLHTDASVQGLKIYRSDDAHAAVVLNGALLPFAASQYIDRDVVEGESYEYRVAAVGYDGEEFLSPPARVTTPATVLRLEQNTPNPFNPSTTISYSIAQKGRVRLDVYDASGARVATLVDGVRGAGSHEARWDGVDASGRVAASGVYFCVLRSGGRVVTRKMALLK